MSAAGTEADCTQGVELMEGIDAEYLPADKGSDTEAIAEKVTALDMKAGIPPKSNRKNATTTPASTGSVIL